MRKHPVMLSTVSSEVPMRLNLIEVKPNISILAIVKLS